MSNKVIQLNNPNTFFKGLKTEREILTAKACIAVLLENSRTVPELLALLTSEEQQQVYEHTKRVIEKRKKAEHENTRGI